MIQPPHVCLDGSDFDSFFIFFYFVYLIKKKTIFPSLTFFFFFYILLFFPAFHPTTQTAMQSRRTPGRGKAKAIERPGLSEEEIEEIREAFNLFDSCTVAVHRQLVQESTSFSRRTVTRKKKWREKIEMS